jgi:glycosyltransferase involved in cell wall biosynthesis
MKIGIWIPKQYLTSVRIYSEHVCEHLAKLGVEVIPFTEKDDVPDVDVVWDPTCTSARFPNRKFWRSDLNWVVTVHGASNLSLPLKYTFPTFKKKMRGIYINAKRRFAWSIYRNKVAHIITVSKFAKEELVQELDFQPGNISVIYHGFDDINFHPQSGDKDYLLHISVYQPKKNVDRIIEAYSNIPVEKRMPFTLVCPGYPHEVQLEKLNLVREHIDRKNIGKLMRGAFAFIFPSIHESFGMPLVEAMACGTPVITSSVSSCPEIVQDAGILVDPYSVPDIKLAIEKLSADPVLRKALSEKALERAKDFSWEKTARLHLEVFKRFII